MLPFRARADLGAMAMKGYSTFSKAPALQEPHRQTHVGEVLLFYRDAVGVFYSPSRLGMMIFKSIQSTLFLISYPVGWLVGWL